LETQEAWSFEEIKIFPTEKNVEKIKNADFSMSDDDGL